MLSNAAYSRGAPSAVTPDLQSDWYAVYTRHQHEKTVARILASKGFEAFLPLCSTVHRWNDRNKQLWLPLFPCYVFFRQGIERRLEILTTPGIHALVSCGSQPAAIPCDEIDAIKRVTESGAYVEPHPFLKCGEWVRVQRGPLTGIRGILLRQKSVYRLILSVDILGQSAAVEVDAFAVETLSAAEQSARTFAPGAVAAQRAV